MQIRTKIMNCLVGLVLVLSASCSKDATVVTENADSCSNAIGNGATVVAGPSLTYPTDDNDSVFRSLVVSPTSADILSLGSERNGPLISSDGGSVWERGRSGIRTLSMTYPSGVVSGYPEVWSIAFSPADATKLLLATTDSPGPVSGNYPSSVAGVYKSNDGGSTWTRSNCGLTNSKASYILYDPADATGETALLAISGDLASFSPYVGQLFDGGIFRSVDAGTTWTASTMPAGSNASSYWKILARSYSGDYVYYTFGIDLNDTAESVGFLKSTDRGVTWSAIGSSMSTKFIGGNFDASSDGQTLYACDTVALTGWKSTNGGTSWAQTAVSPNGPLAVSPDNADTVIYAAYDTVYRSTDGMATSSIVLSPATQIGAITFAPSNPLIVYVATVGYKLYKSTDGGANFTYLLNLRSDVINN